MHFSVLGPVEVRRAAQVLSLTAPKPRLLLAILLSRAGQVLHTDSIVDALWYGRPPRSAVDNLRGYAHQLRRLLGDPNRVVRQSGGYLLAVGSDELDAWRFEELAAQGRSLFVGGAPERARDTLTEALALWRGPAFADLADAPIVNTEAARLQERRVAALEARIDADLATDRHVDAVAELSVLVAEHPLHERFRAQLMLALYRSGRQAEALQVYRDTWRILRDELGVEPGPELRQLERAMLTAETSLASGRRLSTGTLRASPPTAGPAITTPTPAQLPADLPTFTGRAATLSSLDAIVEANARIIAITGTPGVGKTALAVHWSHRVRERFPHGQLYVNLRGYAATARVRPIDALAQFLRALDISPGRVPVDVEEAAALYRSILADRRLLIVLDNARDPEHVRPLLPGGSGCLVLITSRDRMSGLAVGEGAERVPIDVLDGSDAVRLLASLLGAARLSREPQAASELANACARLPLALRIAAAQLVDEPNQSISHYVERLYQTDRVSALLVDGDESVGVRATFDLSYRALDAAAQRLFRLLGLVPGRDMTVGAAAAVAGEAPAQVSRLLRALVAAHLLDQPEPGRFGFHDLLRSYAGGLTEQVDEGIVRRAAMERLMEWYLERAAAAVVLIAPQTLRLPAVEEAAAQPRVAESFETERDALHWLDEERTNLIAAAKHAADNGLHRYAWCLADAMRGYQRQRRYLVDWIAVADAGLAAAGEASDAAAKAACLLSLADASSSLGRHDESIGQYVAAAESAQASRWRHGEAAARGNLGAAYSQLGRLDEAAESIEEALAINRRTDMAFGMSANLLNLGKVYGELGRSEEAVARLTEVRLHLRRKGAVAGEAHALTNIGEALLDLGRIDAARASLTEALVRHREIGDRYGEAVTLSLLATTEREAGAADRGLEHAQQALSLSAEIGDPRIEADVRGSFAAVLLSLGQADDAAHQFEGAVQLCRDIGNRYPLVVSLTGLAAADRLRGALGAARQNVAEALTIARSSGYRLREGHALTEYAAILLAGGAPDSAIEHAECAADIHQHGGHTLAAARAVRVLGQALHAQGRPEAALSAWRKATDLFGDASMPEAAELRAQKAANWP